MNNYNNPAKLIFHSMATVEVQIFFGAAGFLDTDVSATIGIHPERLYLVVCKNGTGVLSAMGVRMTGDTVDSHFYASSATALTKVSSLGHVDCYRIAAGNMFYYFIGYFE
jgi:hypothetical protein